MIMSSYLQTGEGFIKINMSTTAKIKDPTMSLKTI